MNDLTSARERWQTSSDEDEQQYWSNVDNPGNALGILRSWHDDHPDWNPGVTEKQLRRDAHALWTWGQQWNQQNH